MRRPGLKQRLELIFEWYRGMVSPETRRLVYEYRPIDDMTIADGAPIRDIAAIWDLAALSRCLARAELRPLIEHSLDHYLSLLVRHRSGWILDPAGLGEPSSIAHSAFLVLALLSSEHVAGAGRFVDLLDAIVAQQRDDGSYRIHFGGEPDVGLDLYPGEAMLAILEGHVRSRERRYLESAERAFAFHRDHRPPATVDRRILVFYANWQAQAGALLHEHARSDHQRASVQDYVCSLHDRIVESGFYDRIERSPEDQATVEVACALEGVNDAYAIARSVHDADRRVTYARCIRIALAYLLRAQRIEGCTPRERGGFGHSLADRTQRIDVTGHVVAGFIKSLRNQITVEAD